MNEKKNKQTNPQDPTTYCLEKTHFRHKNTHRLKVKEWKKIFHANCTPRTTGMAVLISNKLEFKSKLS